VWVRYKGSVTTWLELSRISVSPSFYLQGGCLNFVNQFKGKDVFRARLTADNNPIAFIFIN
jgi:hypothetical protein